MKSDTIRAWLAILIVGTSLFVSAAIVLYPIFNAQVQKANEYADLLKTWWTVQAGLVGAVVGYFFGHGGERSKPAQKKTGPDDKDRKPPPAP